MTTTKSSIGPQYEHIRDCLKEAIASKSLKPGQVLLENPLAKIFETSRAPVRKALAELHQEGQITRFAGRGYLVGTDSNGPVHRVPLTRESVGPSSTAIKEERLPLAERVFEEVKANVAMAMAFGQFGIGSADLAEHYSVSRTISREILAKLKDRGLVSKDSSGRWVTGPLKAIDIQNEYELRALLEPQALIKSVPFITSVELNSMRDRLEGALKRANHLKGSEVLEIEEDLHDRALRCCKNERLLSVISQNQTSLVVNAIFYSYFSGPVIQPMLNEHLEIVHSLLAGNSQLASSQLRHHLDNAASRTRQRLKSLSVLPEPSLPNYLCRIS